MSFISTQVPQTLWQPDHESPTSPDEDVDDPNTCDGWLRDTTDEVTYEDEPEPIEADGERDASLEGASWPALFGFAAALAALGGCVAWLTLS